MNYYFKSILMSLVFHSLIILIILGTSYSFVRTNKLIMIDLTFEDPINNGGKALHKTTLKPAPKLKIKGQKPQILSKISEFNVQKTEVIKQGMEIKEQKQNEIPKIIPNLNQVKKIETEVPVPTNIEQGEKPQNNEYDFNKDNGSQKHLTDSSSPVDGHYDDSGSIKNAKKESSSTNLGNTNNPGITRYLKENFTYIRDMIQKNILYPRNARQMGWEGKVMVSFIITSDGHANNINIVKSSGIEVLDKNAVNTIKKVSPFPRPPAMAKITMPIIYKLN